MTSRPAGWLRRANCSVNGMTGIRARMISPRMMPTPAPPQVASHRSSFLPRVKPRMAIRANSTSEQVLRIFGGQMGWLVKMAMRAITAAASPATPM